MATLTEPKRRFLQLRLDTLFARYGKISYDDALVGAKESERWIRCLPIDDIAYDKFYRDYRSFMTMAGLIASLEELDRHDHCHPVRVLYVAGSEIEEKTFWISLSIWTTRELAPEIKRQIGLLYPGLPVNQIEYEVLDEHSGKAWTNKQWEKTYVPWKPN